MSQLNKTQLEADNQASFPNNNAGFITPSILRGFNTNMIDSLVDEGEYNINSASFSGSIAALQNFSSSLDSTYATDAQLNYSSSVLQADINTKATVTGSNKFAGSQTISGSLFLSSSVVGDPHQIGNTSGGDLFINGAAGADLIIESDSTLTVNANNGVTVNATLNVDDLTILEEGLIVTGSPYNAVDIQGGLHLMGGVVSITGSTNIYGNLDMQYDAAGNGIIYSNEITSSNIRTNNLEVTASLRATGSLNVSGSATITGSTNITGSTSIKGNTTITGSVRVLGNEDINGNLTATNLTINGLGTNVMSGSLIINQNLTVLGSSSVNYITSSQLSVGTNIISVNTQTPGVRFGGLVVNDSGSLPQNSGSLFFDSIENRWVSIHTLGTGVSSSVLILGPETYNDLGNENGLTANYIPKALSTDGNHNIGDSSISDNGSVVTINSNLQVNDASNLIGGLTASGLNYPTTDGVLDQFLSTDGAGNLTFDWVKTLHQNIRNVDSVSIVIGTPLFVSGSTGDNADVFIADAGNPLRRPATLIAYDATLAAGGTGTGIISGEIQGVDTNAYPAGTVIYLASGGGWTSTRPTGSASVQVLGVVTRQANNGRGIVFNQVVDTLPNIQSGYVWVGDGSSYPVAVATASLQGVQFPYTGSARITGSLDVIGKTSVSGALEVTSSLVVNGVIQLTGSLGISGSIPTIQNAGSTGSIVSTLGDSYTDVPAGYKIVTLTSASYASIPLKDPNTIYFVTGSLPYGSSGTAGSSGTSGVSINGTNGTSGVNGTSGINGTNGVAGTSGTSGVNGSNGTSGTSGFNGAPGNPGTSGTSGTSGVDGTSGVNGTSGTSGVSGTSGTSGESQLYTTTSTTSISIGSIGNNRTITVGAGLDFTVGQPMVCAYDVSNYMEGIVVSYNDITGSMTFQITNAVGSGTYASWVVNLQAASGPAGSNGTSGTSFLPTYIGNVDITGSVNVLGSIGVQVGTESGSVVDNRNDIYPSVPRIEHIVTLTEAEYAGLAVPDVNTLYIISGSNIVDTTFPYTGSAQITGSLGVTGSILNDGVAVINSSVTSSMSVLSSSYAITASYALNAGGGGGASFPYTGSAIISGSLIITGSVAGNIVSASIASSTASIDFNAGGFFTCLAPNGTTHFNIVNASAGESVTLRLTTVGIPTASFSSNVKQISGSAYLPTSGSNNTDLLTFVAYDSSNVYLLPAKKFI